MKIFHDILVNDSKNKSVPEMHDLTVSKLLSGELGRDGEDFKKMFDRCSDIIYRDFKISGEHRAMLFFLDGFVDAEQINSDLLKPLLNCSIKDITNRKIALMDINSIIKAVVSVANINKSRDFREIIENTFSGKTILLVDGINEALVINLIKTEKRAISESTIEPVIRGPRDGFTEDLQTNITLVRKRIKTPKLKTEKLQVGKISKTNVIVSYIEGVADEALINEIKSRISLIEIDAVLESGYIEEMIEDNRLSVFPQLGYTERPDRLASSLLEGQVAIFVDNTPIVLIAPYTFIQALQSGDDYYERYIPAVMIRSVRYLFLMLALLLPSFYIAVLTFHQGMIPRSLLFTIWQSREGVPFPTFVETIIMEVFFEGLREAGIRLPGISGQTVSIVGALVIGEAAVRAGIVSSATVIIVAITGIASFILPRYNIALSIRVLRFGMMILAGTLGLYGMFLGIFFILIHMAKLQSFGVPYLSPVAPLNINSLKDVLIRAPRWAMTNRPGFISSKNRQRMKNPELHLNEEKNN
ncbi:MAG: spore germination protein [Bacillota bacterium]|nr:spore germination protein [Bacillota bacterium]